MKSRKRTGKMRDEFSVKRLLSIFRYCFGNVSGMFRDWFSFCKPKFRPEISRNHAPGFLISKGTKRMRETWDIIYMIANGSCHYLYDFYQKNTDNSYRYAQKFTDKSSFISDFLLFLSEFSPIFSDFSLIFPIFLRIFAPEIRCP